MYQTCKSATIKGGRRQKHNNHRSSYRKDYHTTVIINDCAVNVLIDTGADINVMSQDIATTIGIKWKKSKVKIRPHGSKPLKVCGEFQGSIGFGNTVVMTEFLW